MNDNIVEYVKTLKFNDEEEKDLFIGLAEEFQAGGETFYTYTPAQLAKVTKYTLEGAWALFLGHTSIKVWLDKRMAIILDAAKRRSTMQFLENMDNGVSSNDIKNLTNIINEGKIKDNTVRIFITRIPEKDEA